MTTERKLYIVGFILFAIFTAFFVHERELRIHAEDKQASDEALVTASQDAIKSRDASAAQITAALAAQSAALKTPQQAAQVIHDYLPVPTAAPGQPAPVVPQIPIVDRSDLSTKVQAELPSAPSYGILTQQQLIDQAQSDLACKATGTQLTACQQDKIDMQKQIDAKADEAKTWEAAAKGGTKMHRFLKAMECVALAGGAAYAGAQTKNPKWAGVGAAAGVGACQLF